MINVVDEVLNTTSTGGVIKYNLTHADNTTELVQINMATPVQTAGTPINKVLFDSIQSDFDSSAHKIPSGLICMWSGSSVPTGWYLCNGQNGTPDLRDRFIVGSGSSYQIGATGGENSHTLTTQEMPSHSHDIHTYRELSSLYDTYVLGLSNSGADLTKAYKARTYNQEKVVVATGGGQAHENRPPYYALAFIMKA